MSVKNNQDRHTVVELEDLRNNRALKGTASSNQDNSQNVTECWTLEDLLKFYPGLSHDGAALLNEAHRLSKKIAA